MKYAIGVSHRVWTPQAHGRGISIWKPLNKLVLPHGSISLGNSARIISGWTHGNIYLRLEEGKSRVLTQWTECLVQMPLSWAHWLGLCSCLEWLAHICDGFCWRLWFPKCLLSFTGLGFASLKPRASMILLDFLKNDTDKRQFRTDKPKHTYNIFHLEQNQRNLTLHKKSPRCERWARSSFYRSTLSKVSQKLFTFAELGFVGKLSPRRTFWKQMRDRKTI
jgi:hypothetical protein